MSLNTWSSFLYLLSTGFTGLTTTVFSWDVKVSIRSSCLWGKHFTKRCFPNPLIYVLGEGIHDVMWRSENNLQEWVLLPSCGSQGSSSDQAYHPYPLSSHPDNPWFLLFCFVKGLCSHSCPRTQYTDQASKGLSLKVSATILGFFFFLRQALSSLKLNHRSSKWPWTNGSPAE